MQRWVRMDREELSKGAAHAGSLNEEDDPSSS